MMERKNLNIQMKQMEGRKRLRFIASTETPDRDGDELLLTGWGLDNYKKNPVILYGHNYSSLPVAKAVSIGTTKSALEVEMEFPPDGVHDFADTVYKLASLGFINAVSVGFLGMEYTPLPTGGKRYTKQQLLEISLVPVPAQPEALQTLMAKGVINTRQAASLLSKQEIDLNSIPKMTKKDNSLPPGVVLSSPAADWSLPRKREVEIEIDHGGGVKSKLTGVEAERFVQDAVRVEIQRRRGNL